MGTPDLWVFGAGMALGFLLRLRDDFMIATVLIVALLLALMPAA